MNGIDIKNYVEERLGRSFEDSFLLQGINEALLELGDLPLIPIEATVVFEEGDDWFELPGDFTKVVKVIKVEEEDYLYLDWEYRDGLITFNEPGTYIIYARKMAPQLNYVSETITEVHQIFNNALKYYVLAWVRESEDLDDETAQILYERFYQRVERAHRTLKANKSPAKVQVIRRA
jgi:hypothetical protein